MKAVCSVLIFFAIYFAACSAASPPASRPVIAVKGSSSPSPSVVVSASPTAASFHIPEKYTSQIILKGIGRPDDLVPEIHALIRFNLVTGKRETLARQGFIEPQGLLIDEQGALYVSNDYANMIVKLNPA